jgi:hypothetical protein
MVEPEETFVARQRLCKHIAATNAQETIEALLEMFLFGPCKVIIREKC